MQTRSQTLTKANQTEMGKHANYLKERINKARNAKKSRNAIRNGKTSFSQKVKALLQSNTTTFNDDLKLLLNESGLLVKVDEREERRLARESRSLLWRISLA